MSKGLENNKSSSGTTPATAAASSDGDKIAGVDRDRRPDKLLTEAELLAHQAQEARQAMSRVLGLIGNNLGHTIDPRSWTRTHPWISLTGAAAAGFTVGAMVPTADKQTKNRVMRRLSALERALKSKLRMQKNGYVDGSDSIAGGSARRGLLGRFLVEIFKVIRPALTAAIGRGLSVLKHPARNSNEPKDGPDDPPPNATADTSGRGTSRWEPPPIGPALD